MPVGRVAKSLSRFPKYIPLLPAAILFLISSIYPIVYNIWISMNHVELGTLQTTWVGIGNYYSIFADPMFWRSLTVDVSFASATTGLQVLAGLGIALLLNERFPFRRFVRTLVFLTYLSPIIAVAIVFKWMLSDMYGIVDKVLISLNIIAQPISFLGDVQYALPSLIAVNGWMYTSFVVIVLVARLQVIDPAQYEAAKVFGASAWRRFMDVTLPSLRSSILLVILLRWVWMFTKFDSIWMITQGGPLYRTTTLPILAYIKAFQYYDFGEAAAISTIVFVVLSAIAVVYFVVFKPEREVMVKK